MFCFALERKYLPIPILSLLFHVPSLILLTRHQHFYDPRARICCGFLYKWTKQTKFTISSHFSSLSRYTHFSLFFSLLSIHSSIFSPPPSQTVKLSLSCPSFTLRKYHLYHISSFHQIFRTLEKGSWSWNLSLLFFDSTFSKLCKGS